MRFGLCCLFVHEPVRFRTTTAKVLLVLPRDRQLVHLSQLCHHNARNLLLALEAVKRLGIGAFRIMSPLFPRMTHPEVCYRLDDLPDGAAIAGVLEEIRKYALAEDIRLSFHPDQFVVLSSPHPAVVDSSLRELAYQGELAEAVGADVINIHAGGVYGDKRQALMRLEEVFPELPEAVRGRLTLENDDSSYTPQDLLPICQRLSIPLVYDAHHHRCNPDRFTVGEATALAGETWERAGREPYCHLSSPKAGWKGSNPRPHADFIDPADFPECWLGREMTVDVEAKAKEQAVARLMEWLRRGRRAVIEPSKERSNPGS
jgi:UV DNA damage endonuclease